MLIRLFRSIGRLVERLVSESKRENPLWLLPQGMLFAICFWCSNQRIRQRVRGRQRQKAADWLPR